MVEIPLHSRVQSHTSSLRPEGGGLSGFKCCTGTIRMSHACRIRTEAGGGTEREQGRRIANRQERGRKVRSARMWGGSDRGGEAQVVKYQSKGCSSDIMEALYCFAYLPLISGNIESLIWKIHILSFFDLCNECNSFWNEVRSAYFGVTKSMSETLVFILAEEG